MNFHIELVFYVNRNHCGVRSPADDEHEKYNKDGLRCSGCFGHHFYHPTISFHVYFVEGLLGVPNPTKYQNEANHHRQKRKTNKTKRYEKGVTYTAGSVPDALMALLVEVMPSPP